MDEEINWLKFKELNERSHNEMKQYEDEGDPNLYQAKSGVFSFFRGGGKNQSCSEWNITYFGFEIFDIRQNLVVALNNKLHYCTDTTVTREVTPLL